MPVPISNVTRRAVYSPTGTGGAGPYAFTFEILANTDIAVYKDDVLLTLTTHYTVSIASNGTGSVTITATGLALSPTSPTQYAIVGNRTISRSTDFTTGGDFFANTLNDELDQQTIFAQQNAEGLTRSLQAPQTDPTTVDMTLPRASVRANKTLAFDSNGDPTTGEVIGDNRGNWSTSTAYNKRDIIKDTSNGNIYYANTSHTSTGSQPISTNADSAKWDLIVDNASATSSATAAAASASAASTSASNASTSASGASTSATNAANSASTASTQASNASTSATAAAASASSASSSATSATSSASTATTQASNASTSASNASTSASNAATSETNAAASASTATTQASNASTSATNAATSASTATTQATNASNSATAAQTAQTAAEAARDSALAAYDNFDDRYLGAKSSNPTVDNDGNTLLAGALYFNTVAPEMRLWTGSAWVAAYVSGTGFLASANNLSDLASAPTARTNLGLGTAAVVADSTLVHTSGNETIAGTKTFSSDASISGLTVGKGGGAVATNTALGYQALNGNSSGVGLFVAGYQAGLVTTGSYSTFTGYQAGKANTSGENTAYGANALLQNTTGTANTALGGTTTSISGALASNTTGGSNVGVGVGALSANTTASNNTAIGYQAGYSNTTGANLVALGRLAGYSNTTANDNTFVGVQSGYTNSTGASNAFFGTNAGYTNNGSSNTALGVSALQANTTGIENTAVGYQALNANTTASYNTSVGRNSLYLTTTGTHNTCIGHNSGYNISTGTKNTILGRYDGNQGSLDIRTSSNYIVLSDGDGNPRGYFEPSGNFIVTRTTNSGIQSIGCYQDTSASAANVFITTGGSFVRSTSSRKYKTDIQDATHGLADVLNLRSVTYKGTGNHDSEQVLGGLIAEEVHDAGLTEFVQYADDGTPDALAYGHMASLFVKAIQELKTIVDAQASEITALKAKVGI